MALKGWFSKGFWGKVAKAIIATAAVSIGGPIAGIIAAGIIKLGEEKGYWRGESNPYVEGEIENWRVQSFTPYVEVVLQRVSNTSFTPSVITLLNFTVAECYAWKAYYEFIAIKEKDQDEILIAEEKVILIGEFIEVVKKAIKDNAPKHLGYYTYPFEATEFKQILNENLDWRGAKSVKAEKSVLTDRPYSGSTNTGGSVSDPFSQTTKNPYTGGSTTPGGGFQTTNPKVVTIPTKTGGGYETGTTPKTGGGTTHGGGHNTGINPGGGKVPVPTKPIRYTGPPINPGKTEETQLPETPKKSNKNLIILAVGVGLLALFTRK